MMASSTELKMAKIMSQTEIPSENKLKMPIKTSNVI